MRKQKPYLLILIVLGLMLTSVRCDVLPFDLLSEGPDPATTESPPGTPVPPNEQQDAGETPVGREDDGGFGGWLNFTNNWPLLLILALSFIAVLLLLIVWRRRRGKRGPAPAAPQGTTPLVDMGTTEKKITQEMEHAPRLTLVTDAETRLSFPLEREPLTIGRGADNDLVIEEHVPGHETVSRTHARLYQRAGYWIIEDLNSRNGVYINQQRTGRNLLQEGWTISIGGVTFRFHTQKAEVAA